MNQHEPPEHPVVQKIADALGVPVACFFANPRSTGPASGEDECLRLWGEIRTEEGRRQALQLLRVIAQMERR